MSKQTIRVELFDYGWSDEVMPLDQFKAIVDAAVASVPPGSKASFEVEPRWGDDGTSRFRAYYDRLENDEEYERRLQRKQAAEAAQAALNERRSRQLYEQLKAKYEPESK